MLTVTQCRELAQSYRSQVKDPAVPPKTAAICRNIANSLTGLAKQLEMLDEDELRVASLAGPSKDGGCASATVQ
ncbi:hypothetical protein ACVWZM_000747 [Bradyrhizobium sp. USDA 4501]